jgi:hypothetical protein
MPTTVPDDMPLAVAPELPAEAPLAAPVPPGVPLRPTTSPEPPEPVETLLPDPAVAVELPDVIELPVVAVEFPEPPAGVPDMPIGTVLAS